MARDIEAMFVGGPRPGRRGVAVTGSGRLPDEVREGSAIYRLQPSATTWDGEYHYQDARYLFQS